MSVGKTSLWMSLCIGVFGSSLAACQNPVSEVHAESHHYTDQQNCPALLVMKVGETLEFNAAENPSTGYQWQIMQPLHLFKVEEQYLATEKSEAMVGVGGKKTVKLTALKPGQELIDLAYVRPWEVAQDRTQKDVPTSWQCRVRIS